MHCVSILCFLLLLPYASAQVFTNKDCATFKTYRKSDRDIGCESSSSACTYFIPEDPIREEMMIDKCRTYCGIYFSYFNYMYSVCTTSLNQGLYDFCRFRNEICSMERTYVNKYGTNSNIPTWPLQYCNNLTSIVGYCVNDKVASPSPLSSPVYINNSSPQIMISPSPQNSTSTLSLTQHLSSNSTSVPVSSYSVSSVSIKQHTVNVEAYLIALVVLSSVLLVSIVALLCYQIKIQLSRT